MSYEPIRPLDLQDPTLNKLNQQLAFLYASITGTSTSSSPVWSDYQVQVTPSGSMTASGLSLTQAKFQQVNSECLLMLDIRFTLGGSAAGKITLTIPPVLPADKLTVETTFSCTIIQGSSSVAGTAVLSSGVITVAKYDGSNFTLGACRVLLCGAYRV